MYQGGAGSAGFARREVGDRMDAQSYEAEILVKVREILASAEVELQAFGIVVMEVGLQGSYPSTVVVVTFKKDDEATKSSWLIWLPPTTPMPATPENTKIAPDS